MALQTVDLAGAGTGPFDRVDPAAGAPVSRRSGAAVPVARLFQAALLLLVVGQLGRIPVLAMEGKEAPLLLTDVLAVGLVVVGAAVMLRRRDVRVNAVCLVALLFVGVGGMSAILAVPRFGLSAFEAMFSLAYLARWATYLALYVVILNAVRRDEVEGIWKALETAILLFAGFGIVQSALLPDFAFIVYPEAERFLDWDPQGRRLVSTLLDPNYAGFLIVVGLLVYGGRLAAGARVAGWKLGVLATALVLTLSRSSLVALAVGAMAVATAHPSSRRMLKAGLGLVLAVVVTSPFWLPFADAFNKLALDDPSAYLRLVQWGWALTILVDNPIVGVGFNTYGFVSSIYDVGQAGTAGFGLDGGLLFIAVMTGVLGSALFLALLVLLFRSAWKAGRDEGLDPGQRGLALGAAAAVPAVAVHSLFANTLLYAPLLFALWVLWGCASRLGSD